MKIVNYEKDVILLLCSGRIERSVLHNVINDPESIAYKHSGEGYYLDLRHRDLPFDRIVCDKPDVIGKYQEQEVGFIVFIENQTLCLECYNLSSKGVPESIRYETIEIISENSK